MIKVIRIPGGPTNSNLTSGTVAQILASVGIALGSGEAATVGGSPVSLDTQVSDGTSIVISKSAKGNGPRVVDAVLVNGQNAADFSVDKLFSTAQDLQGEIASLTKSNAAIQSKVIQNRIDGLNSDLKKVVELLDAREEK